MESVGDAVRFKYRPAESAHAWGGRLGVEWGSLVFGWGPGATAAGDMDERKDNDGTRAGQKHRSGGV